MESLVKRIRGLLVSVIIMLFILVSFEAYDLGKQRLEADLFEQRVTEVEKIVENQRDFIIDLYSEYQDAAYRDPNLNGIMAQQLRALEYNLQALQILSNPK